MAVKIVTDSTSDLKPQIASDLGITVVPLYINFGKESYRDGVDLTTEEFYRRLASSRILPTTAVPGPATFAQVRGIKVLPPLYAGNSNFIGGTMTQGR